MNLKLSTQGNLVLTERGGVDIIVNTTGKDEKFEQGVLSAGFTGTGFHRPGEYEQNDVFVMSLEKRVQNVGNPNVFKISYSGVEVLVVTDVITELTKPDLDLIGEADVMVINAVATDQDLNSILRKVNPYFLVLADTSLEAKVSKDLNMPVLSTEKTYKFEPSQFAEEEFSTNLIVLA